MAGPLATKRELAREMQAMQDVLMAAMESLRTDLERVAEVVIELQARIPEPKEKRNGPRRAAGRD